MKNLAKNPIKKLLAVVTFVGAASTAAAAAPRTLANGAPAPGNTVAKGYQEKESTAARRLDEARRALASALAEEREAKRLLASQPRTLPNGSPACGNTFAKVCPERVAEQTYQAVLERARVAEKGVALARERLHEATRKVALEHLDGGRGVAEGDEYS